LAETVVRDDTYGIERRWSSKAYTCLAEVGKVEESLLRHKEEKK